MGTGRYRSTVAASLEDRSALVAGYVVAVASVTALRVVVGSLLGDPVVPVTYVGVAGGAVGGVVVVAPMRSLLGVEDDELAALRAFQWAHALLLAAAGGAFPRVVHALTGSTALYAALPGAVVTGIAYGGALFGVAAVCYVVLVGLSFEEDATRRWAGLFGLYLGYGLVLGFVAGLTTSVWYPLFGV